MSKRGKSTAPLSAAGLVIIDKTSGVTSHDVVARCRKAFNTRRVGHAGTLDPMATGVLVVGVERATKLLGHLSLDTKEYTATIRLGFATSTDDAVGERTWGRPAGDCAPGEWEAAANRLVGSISQTPPEVSAIKVDGRRAHARKRDGETVTLAPRRVTVDRFDVLGARRHGDMVDLQVGVACSSGTYIRALARDVGEELGVGGHVTALRRTRVGPFDLTRSRTLACVQEDPVVGLGIDDAVRTAFPLRDISAEEAEAISQGRWLDPVGMKGTYGVVDPEGRVVALLREKGRRASSVMVVRPATLRQ